MKDPHIQVLAIHVGKPVPVTYKKRCQPSAIDKTAVDGGVYLSSLNFDGDEQGDTVNHGGKDKAVCAYSFEHYPHWEKFLNRPLTLGAFGENLTLKGLTEDKVCIGDIFQIGEACIQVSQPRLVCWKLAMKYDEPKLPYYFQNSGFTGMYFRVVKEGWVDADKKMTLLERHPMEVRVDFANRIMNHDKDDLEAVVRILKVDALSDQWRRLLSNRLKGIDMDVISRLEGL